jgi:hypothetical protein
MAREFLLKNIYTATNGSATQVGTAVDLIDATAHTAKREIIVGAYVNTTAGSLNMPITFQESSGSAVGGTWTDVTIDSALTATTANDGLYQRFAMVTQRYLRATIGTYASAGSANINIFAVPMKRFA